MAYQKQTWNNGDIITKEKMDHIEEGIFNIELTLDLKGQQVHKEQQDQKVTKEKPVQRVKMLLLLN